MGRGKKKKKQTSDVLAGLSAVTAEEWRKIVVDAIREADEKKLEKIEIQREKDLQEWRKEIGAKDFSKEKKLKRWVLGFLNAILVVKNIFFIPKEKVRGDRMTFFFLQSVPLVFFRLIYMVLLFVSAIFTIAFPILLWRSNDPFELTGFVFIIALGFLAFILALLFRIVYLEIENIQDRNYMVGLFSSVTVTVSIIISIIAILISRG